jgi:hypothetical protein
MGSTTRNEGSESFSIPSDVLEPERYNGKLLYDPNKGDKRDGIHVKVGPVLHTVEKWKSRDYKQSRSAVICAMERRCPKPVLPMVAMGQPINVLERNFEVQFEQLETRGSWLNQQHLRIAKKNACGNESAGHLLWLFSPGLCLKLCDLQVLLASISAAIYIHQYLHSIIATNLAALCFHHRKSAMRKPAALQGNMVTKTFPIPRPEQESG